MTFGITNDWSGTSWRRSVSGGRGFDSFASTDFEMRQTSYAISHSAVPLHNLQVWNVWHIRQNNDIQFWKRWPPRANIMDRNYNSKCKAQRAPDLKCDSGACKLCSKGILEPFFWNWNQFAPMVTKFLWNTFAHQPLNFDSVCRLMCTVQWDWFTRPPERVRCIRSSSITSACQTPVISSYRVLSVLSRRRCSFRGSLLGPFPESSSHSNPLSPICHRDS
jgi:hypothetical protein